MHTCIMVKVGGNEKHIKYVKTRTFNENRGEFGTVGEKIISEIEWKCIEIAKIWRKFKI